MTMSYVDDIAEEIQAKSRIPTRLKRRTRQPYVQRINGYHLQYRAAQMMHWQEKCDIYARHIQTAIYEARAQGIEVELSPDTDRYHALPGTLTDEHISPLVALQDEVQHMFTREIEKYDLRLLELEVEISNCALRVSPAELSHAISSLTAELERINLSRATVANLQLQMQNHLIEMFKEGELDLNGH